MIYDSSPLISIVIPTCNSAKTLRLCLNSIRKQTYKRIEVVVVDCYSSDETTEIAKKYGARVFRVHGERSIQMNFGARVARGKYVYFVGSDFVLHPRVVEESVSLALSGCDAIVVMNLSDPRPSVVARARFFERLFYHGGSPYEAARFIRRDLFLRVGGFDERLYANEDIDLHRRLVASGARVCHTRQAFEVHVGEPKSFKEFILKSLYYGRSYVGFLRKHAGLSYATPIRTVFLKRNFIALTGRRWFWGLFLVPLIKTVQFMAGMLGALLPLSVNPYGKRELQGGSHNSREHTDSQSLY